MKDLRRGLPMVAQRDPAAVEREKQRLIELSRAPLPARIAGYLRLSGPGYMQSAMTLGSGTAMAALFAGAAFGYQLLWVAPLAMLLGVIMLAAIAHVTLSSGVRPFDALRRHAHPAIAWGWAIGSLLASVIWHFPQYSLAGASVQDLFKAHDVAIPAWPVGLAVLAIAIPVTWGYGSSNRGLRAYETFLKLMVWMVVVCFGIVVLQTGIDDLGAFFKGFIPSVPEDRVGMTAAGKPFSCSALPIITAGLAAAVGINMTFLFPYTLLARGWGKEHRGLARMDLLGGMFLPYMLATTLMLIASANTLYEGFSGVRFSPVEASQALASIHSELGRYIFDLGLLGMALSTITLHMLVTAFIVCEIFDLDPSGPAYRWAALIPIPGVLGTVFWSDIALYLAVPTTAICGLFLPLAYIGFMILLNRRSFLGEDAPRGVLRWFWNLGLLLGVVVVTAFVVHHLFTKVF